MAEKIQDQESGLSCLNKWNNNADQIDANTTSINEKTFNSLTDVEDYTGKTDYLVVINGTGDGVDQRPYLKNERLMCWRDYSIGDNGITLYGDVVFQSTNGNTLFFDGLGDFVTTLSDGEKLVVDWTEVESITPTNFTDYLKVTSIATVVDRFVTVLFFNIGGTIHSNLDHIPENKNDIYLWGDFDFFKADTNKWDITFKGNVVFQETSRGNFVYYPSLGDYNEELLDGEKLVISNDFFKSTVTNTDFTTIYKKSVNVRNLPYERTLLVNLGGELFDFFEKKQKNSFEVYDYKSKDLSELAPNFYTKLNNITSDINLVHLGDSISTNNYYSKPREDAMYRPPMMTDYYYVSYMEELLRPEGQEYRRYDVGGFFTESGFSTAETKEYDAVWDWVNTASNFRPSLTRVLDGSSCRISYTIPESANRCDYIFRTDSLNADSCTVTVGGTGVVSVYDDNTSSWVEAEGFVFSAKEDGTVYDGGIYGGYRKSFNQKRLKMKINRTNNNGTTVVQIMNNTAGRLTYWGIQYSQREYMFNYLLQARGGHNIEKIRNFEQWDVDYFEPDLIIQQCCVLNEVPNIADASGVPQDVTSFAPSPIASKFIAYTTDLITKTYSPELIPFGLFYAEASYTINPTTDEYWYGYSGENKYTYAEWFKILDWAYKANGINYISAYNYLNKTYKDKAEKENTSLILANLRASGMYGNTFTIDGTHPNTKGSKLIFDTIKNILS